VVKIITNSAEVKAIDLNISISDTIPDVINGDPDRIKQVLLNIANNAIKFTPKGSVSISLEHNSEQQQLVFTVVDTGIGILASDQKKLFKPFSQIDDSTTRQFEGNGLGLAISKNLVELMQGDVTLTSTFGKGTRCSFFITYQHASGDCVPTPNPVSLRLDDINILIVEDNPTNQIVLNKILRQTGATITLANHGEEALELCQKKAFEIILMDWHMPVLDGLETTKVLRKNPAYAQLPILGLTASVMEEDIKACMNAGMNEVITKPINRAELFRIITKYTKQPA
jgi:CheY-like chemotaxis protein/anti-sigma regulatory factor (Ser/Thr protein kinase)